MVQRWVCCVAVLLSAITVQAGDPKSRGAARPSSYDWPQWRGPDRSSVCQETGLLSRWPKEGPPVVWNVEGLGGGYSTPSVANGRIFGMGSQKPDDDQNETVWALDEVTGKQLWQTVITPSVPQVAYGDGPRCTPTVDGDRLYVLGVGGDLACLDVKTGKEIWKKNYAEDFGGSATLQFGYSESPLVDGDRLICTPGSSDASMVALDKKTGKTVWKAEVPDIQNAGYASITIATVGGIRMYIQWFDSCLAGVAAKDGKFLWKYSRDNQQPYNIPTPIVRGDEVFCSAGYGVGSGLVKLTAADGGVNAEEVYSLSGKELQNHHGGMVRVGDYVYLGHGQNAGAPTCIEWKTGKVAWRKDRSSGKGSAAVLYADGILYFRYEDGNLVLIEATPKAYKQKGKFKLVADSGKATWAHPVIANGKLYLRDQDVLVCFDVKKHSKDK